MDGIASDRQPKLENIPMTPADVVKLIKEKDSLTFTRLDDCRRVAMLTELAMLDDRDGWYFAENAFLL